MFFPLIFRSNHVSALVVGGGKIALRKVQDLLAAGVKVQGISPRCIPELDQLIEKERINWQFRLAEPDDVPGFGLIIVATDQHELNQAISQAAHAAGIPVNVVDQPELCTVYFPAVVRHDPLLIAVSTGGEAPFFASHLRQELEKLMENCWTIHAKWASIFRRFVLENEPNPIHREKLFNRFINLEPSEIRSWDLNNPPEKLWKKWLEDSEEMPANIKQNTKWNLNKTTLHKLAQKKYRQSYGYYLLEGTVAIRDALWAADQFYGVVFNSSVLEHEQDRELLSQIHQANIRTLEVSEHDLKLMSDLTTPPPVIAVMIQPPTQQLQIPPTSGLILALDNVSDPGNVGTLLRAAAFYGVKDVWLGKGTVEVYNPKVLRASMAAFMHLTILQDIELHTVLLQAQKLGYLILAAVVEPGIPPVPWRQDGSAVPASVNRAEGNIQELRSPGAVLLLGNEPHGLHPDLIRLADYRLAIPRLGRVDSLNVAMAGAILLDRLLRE